MVWRKIVDAFYYIKQQIPRYQDIKPYLPIAIVLLTTILIHLGFILVIADGVAEDNKKYQNTMVYASNYDYVGDRMHTTYGQMDFMQYYDSIYTIDTYSVYGPTNGLRTIFNLIDVDSIAVFDSTIATGTLQIVEFK